MHGQKSINLTRNFVCSKKMLSDNSHFRASDPVCTKERLGPGPVIFGRKNERKQARSYTCKIRFMAKEREGESKCH